MKSEYRNWEKTAIISRKVKAFQVLYECSTPIVITRHFVYESKCENRETILLNKREGSIIFIKSYLKRNYKEKDPVQPLHLFGTREYLVKFFARSISNALIRVSSVSSPVMKQASGKAPTGLWVTMRKNRMLYSSNPPVESMKTISEELLTYK